MNSRLALRPETVEDTGGVCAWLVGRRLPVVLAVVAMTLAAPTLWVGWVADDYVHQLRMLQPWRLPELHGAIFDLFVFADGDPAHVAEGMDWGLWPWWTHPEVKAAFARPLAGVTHWLDYRLWPRSAVAMHAQSLLWFGGLVAVVAVFYRRMMGGALAAGLAALLFAIDDAHSGPVGFLANRNAVMAMFFGVLVLLAHDRWRRGGWRVGAWLGPLLLLMSLLCAEAGISTCAYLAAYAFFVDPAGRAGRVRSLVAYAVVVVLWRVAWSAAGYGTIGLGLYVDPLSEPVRYLAAVVERVPGLLVGQWATPPADAFFLMSQFLSPSLFHVVWLGVVIALVLLGWCVWSVVRRDAAARFWAAGMLLSLLPICAVFSADRLLLFVGLGAFGLLGQFLVAVFRRRPEDELGPDTAGGRGRASAVLVWGLVVVHLVLAPAALVARCFAPMGPAKFYEQVFVRTPLDESIERQSVVIVSAPLALATCYLPICRTLEGRPVPRHTRVLSASWAKVTLHRSDERTLVAVPEGGYLINPADVLCRAGHFPMVLGQRVELTGMIVEVTRLTADGRPAEATFHFDVPLDDPSLRWLRHVDGEFVGFIPPSIGQTVVLPAATVSF